MTDDTTNKLEEHKQAAVSQAEPEDAAKADVTGNTPEDATKVDEALDTETEEEGANYLDLSEIDVDTPEEEETGEGGEASVALPGADERKTRIVEQPGSPDIEAEQTEEVPAAARQAGADEYKAEKVKTPRAKRKRWYIVHTYSGHENKVKINLERRIETMNMSDKIFRVEVPQKTVTQIKDGKRKEKEERIFPGYVLVEMLMDEDSWYVVRHTPGVTKFVGSQKKPIPAKDSEIKRILMRTAPVSEKVQIDLKVGEVVKIISGPFADFEGTVTEVSPEKERLKASVSIFGRETPVELAFNQVQKS